MNNPLQYSHEDLDRVNTDFNHGLVEAAESLAPYTVHWWTKEIEEKYKILQYRFAELTFKNAKQSVKTLYELLERDYHNRPTCTK
eukprot:639892-Ditylum_brightwellii.AAC.1